MEQYISKAAVVAEINRRKKELIELSNESNRFVNQWACGSLDNILSFIDTLEVKEVDLEKEFDNYTKHILACDVQFKPFTHLYNCAKYFFELGLKAKGE